MPGGSGAAVGEKAGMIKLWAGLIADIPDGYVICDGNNGTPNLLAKFVEGVATAATNPGATGGEAFHTLSEAEMPAHTHSESTAAITTQHGTGSDYSCRGTTGTTTGSKGGGSPHENRPYYYDVAFIMKT